MKKIKDITAALDTFEEAATQHKAASDFAENYKLTNRWHDATMVALKFLRCRNALPQLKRFLTHPNEGVRSWAAIYLLPFDERASLRVLEDLLKNSLTDKLSAKMAIQEWKNGNLKTYLEKFIANQTS